MSINLEDKIRINSLYDIYKGLLTAKQRDYFEYYFLQDYSLAEIADILNVSRNAIHMQIKNIIVHLEKLEDNLQINSSNQKRDKIIDKIKDKNESEEIADLISQLEKV